MLKLLKKFHYQPTRNKTAVLVFASLVLIVGNSYYKDQMVRNAINPELSQIEGSKISSLNEQQVLRAQAFVKRLNETGVKAQYFPMISEQFELKDVSNIVILSNPENVHYITTASGKIAIPLNIQRNNQIEVSNITIDEFLKESGPVALYTSLDDKTISDLNSEGKNQLTLTATGSGKQTLATNNSQFPIFNTFSTQIGKSEVAQATMLPSGLSTEVNDTIGLMYGKLIKIVESIQK